MPNMSSFANMGASPQALRDNMTEHPCKEVVDFYSNPLQIEDVRKFMNKYLAHHGLPPLEPLDGDQSVPPSSLCTRAGLRTLADKMQRQCTMANRMQQQCDSKAQGVSDAKRNMCPFQWRVRLMM